MIFNQKRNKNITVQNAKITLKNTEIEETKEYKYLGCTITNTLNWNEHIKSIKTKITKLVPSLYKIRYRLSRRNKIMLYNSLVKPHLQYAISIYSKTTEQNLNILQKVQNKVL